MLSAETMERIADYAGANGAIAAAQVFGSSATDRERRGSDIDIAVMVRGHMDGFERARLETELSNLPGKDVDPVAFDRASPLLQHQILKYGRLFYEADPEERVRQEVSTRRQYLDSRFLYRIIRDTGDDRSHGG